MDEARIVLIGLLLVNVTPVFDTPTIDQCATSEHYEITSGGWYQTYQTTKNQDATKVVSVNIEVISHRNNKTSKHCSGPDSQEEHVLCSGLHESTDSTITPGQRLHDSLSMCSRRSSLRFLSLAIHRPNQRPRTRQSGPLPSPFSLPSQCQSAP